MAIRFTSFLSHLGVSLERGQRVFCTVALDGVNPESLPPEDRVIAREMFGPIDTIPDSARGVCTLIAGGRSGKTYLLSLYLLYASLTVPLSSLAPGEKAFAAIIAPQLDLAQQDLNYIVGAAESNAQIRSRIISNNNDGIVLSRRDGIPVAIRPFAASRGGVSGRGKSLVSALLSETAFFKDKGSGTVNDDTIFKAVAPRVVPGGLTLIESTPWIRTGLLYQQYEQNFGKPTTSLVAQAPTVLMREDPHILQMVEREYKRDPENASIEFGAEWGSSQESEFFTVEDMDRLFSSNSSPSTQDVQQQQRRGVVAAADLGFVRNSATLVICEGGSPWRAVLLEEIRPSPTRRSVPSEVCSHFCECLSRHSARMLITDQHYRETLREYTSKIGVGLIDSAGPVERFAALRAAIRSGNVVVSPSHPLAARLRRQLMSVRQTMTASGKSQIRLPTDADGSHGDLADCLARAIAGASARIFSPITHPETIEDQLIRSQEKKLTSPDWWMGY